VQSSNADAPKPVKLPTPKVVVIAKPEPVKTVPTPQPIPTRPTAIQPQPVVAKPQPRLFSTEQSAAAHLREVHGIEASGKSLLEMEAIHDRAHGGSQYHFPGMPSLNTTQPVRYQQASNCPNGRCPTVRTTQLTYSRRTTRRR
jgi:outer membrane biosynthesis protein TonB